MLQKLTASTKTNSVKISLPIFNLIAITILITACSSPTPLPTVRVLPTVNPTAVVSPTSVKAPTSAPTIAPPTRDGTATPANTVLAGSTSTNIDPRVQTVLSFLTAKAAGDRETLSTLICVAQETELDAQALSFAGYGARLENAVCNVASADLVTCTGQIAVNYNGEARNFPLGTYAVIEERGAWKWCGEGE